MLTRALRRNAAPDSPAPGQRWRRIRFLARGMGDGWPFSCCRYVPLVHRPLARGRVLIKPTRAFGDHIRLPAQQRPESRHSGTAAKSQQATLLFDHLGADAELPS